MDHEQESRHRPGAPHLGRVELGESRFTDELPRSPASLIDNLRQVRVDNASPGGDLCFAALARTLQVRKCIDGNT